MTEIATDLPRKTRDIHNHHMDSTIWDRFPFRDDDVIVATWAKSGTTWVQQIVAQILCGPDPDIQVMDMGPCLDMRVIPHAEILPALEAQRHRRHLKTHLPLDALPFLPTVKYIYVGRDGRDVAWSLYTHHHNFSDMAYQAFNETPGLVGPPLERPCDDIREYFHGWLDGDGAPFWSFSENIRTWWDARHQPNVMLLHFADLKADPEGWMRRIAEFLEADVKEADWPAIHEYCSFAWMKDNADRLMPITGMIFDSGGKGFINKGTNNRWRDVLSADDCAKFDAVMRERLGAECAEWLERGSAALA